MYDAKLFEKIINCDLSFEELEAFFPQDKREYDLDNSFDKYFSLDKIKHVVELYRCKKISDRYLAHWACAYNWILMATHWHSNDDVTLKDNLIENISEWLDSISFFDETEMDEPGEDYLDIFCSSVETYLSVYHNVDKWKAYYTINKSHAYPEDEALILCVNDHEKYYLEMEGYTDVKIRTSEWYITERQFKEKEKELIALGYVDLLA